MLVIVEVGWWIHSLCSFNVCAGYPPFCSWIDTLFFFAFLSALGGHPWLTESPKLLCWLFSGWDQPLGVGGGGDGRGHQQQIHIGRMEQSEYSFPLLPLCIPDVLTVPLLGYSGGISLLRLPSLKATDWVAYTSQIYFLIVLEAGYPRSRSRQGWFPLRPLSLACRGLPSPSVHLPQGRWALIAD